MATRSSSTWTPTSATIRRYLPELIAGMNRNGQGEVDVMIGSRYVPGGRIEGWPIKRHFMSRAINVYARRCWA